MTKQLSMGPMRLWVDTVDPGLSETNIDVFNWWHNTSTGKTFLCLDNSIGSQAWDQPIYQGQDISAGNLTFANEASLRTSVGPGNTLLLQAYDVDGAAYTTFGTLTAGNSPSLDLSDLVTKGGSYIYRGGGTDVSVADGGTGLSTLTAHSIQVGNGASAPTQLDVGVTGTVLIGNTNADPSFSASPQVTSVTIGSGGPTITSGSGAPGASQPKGSLYLRKDGTGVNDRVYIATDSSGAWTPIVTVG